MVNFNIIAFFNRVYRDHASKFKPLHCKGSLRHNGICTCCLQMEDEYNCRIVTF